MQINQSQYGSLLAFKKISFQEGLGHYRKGNIIGYIINKNYNGKIMSTLHSIQYMKRIKISKNFVLVILKEIFVNHYFRKPIIITSNGNFQSDEFISACILLKINKYDGVMKYLASKMRQQEKHYFSYYLRYKTLNYNHIFLNPTYKILNNFYSLLFDAVTFLVLGMA